MVIATEADADAVTLEEVATIDRHPHVADNLVRVRGKLADTASPQLDQERAVSFHAHALGARDELGEVGGLLAGVAPQADRGRVKRAVVGDHVDAQPGDLAAAAGPTGNR